LSAPVQADSVAGDNAPGWWQRAQDNMAATWLSDQYQLYVPVHTWHNRADYSVQKIASYNETPWGLGGGTYLFDSEGDWHAWYAMGFLDSHDQFEPIAGYGYQKIWRPATDWRLGAGFTLGFTARADYHDYPIPVVLPLLSVRQGLRQYPVHLAVLEFLISVPLRGAPPLPPSLSLCVPTHGEYLIQPLSYRLQFMVRDCLSRCFVLRI
jgi:palmitoyl transferase